MKINKLPNLNETVLAALDFFAKNKPPRLNLKQFDFPIIVGSGNAYSTGLVLFADKPALITNESNFKKTLSGCRQLVKNKTIKQAMVISASGEKDSIWEVKLAKKMKLKTTLLTCSPDSSAAKLADQVIAYRKLPEPYTYNTSTYLGIILSATGERAENIKKFIKNLKLPKDFKKYQAYSFILPDDFSSVAPMLRKKRSELFGPYLSLRAFSYGEARHAEFVNNWNRELIVSFGSNPYFGLKPNRWEIKLPKEAKNGFVMALSYYIIGLIQQNKTPYFKKNIENYCLKTGPKPYGQKKPFQVIVR